MILDQQLAWGILGFNGFQGFGFVVTPGSVPDPHGVYDLRSSSAITWDGGFEILGTTGVSSPAYDPTEATPQEPDTPVRTVLVYGIPVIDWGSRQVYAGILAFVPGDLISHAPLVPVVTPNQIDFIDGFDSLEVTHLPEKWDADSGYPSSLVPGRTEGFAARFLNSTGVLKHTMRSVQNSWTLNFSFRVSNFVGTTVIAQFLDNARSQIELQLLPTGQLAISRNGVLLDVTVQPIRAGLWEHVEFGFVISGTIGQIRLRVLEVERLPNTSSSPLNTRGSVSSSTAGILKLGPQTPGSGVSYDFDDTVLFNGLYFPGQLLV